MKNVFDSKLGRALKLNYWTVVEAAQYICARKAEHINEVATTPPTLDVRDNSSSPLQQSINLVVRYWYDDEHTIQPRNGRTRQ